jgi:hypothetical protein
MRGSGRALLLPLCNKALGDTAACAISELCRPLLTAPAPFGAVAGTYWMLIYRLQARRRPWDSAGLLQSVPFHKAGS